MCKEKVNYVYLALPPLPRWIVWPATVYACCNTAWLFKNFVWWPGTAERLMQLEEERQRIVNDGRLDRDIGREKNMLYWGYFTDD